ncbi:unnamed protein product [Amoebophrya sp. A120]|nr:unnamed protein product [Amoebophrya sp. A120]|eukprot:GSA120T00012854001.1
MTSHRETFWREPLLPPGGAPKASSTFADKKDADGETEKPAARELLSTGPDGAVEVRVRVIAELQNMEQKMVFTSVSRDTTLRMLVHAVWHRLTHSAAEVAVAAAVHTPTKQNHAGRNNKVEPSAEASPDDEVAGAPERKRRKEDTQEANAAAGGQASRGATTGGDLPMKAPTHSMEIKDLLASSRIFEAGTESNGTSSRLAQAADGVFENSLARWKQMLGTTTGGDSAAAGARSLVGFRVYHKRHVVLPGSVVGHVIREKRTPALDKDTTSTAAEGIDLEVEVLTKGHAGAKETEERAAFPDEEKDFFFLHGFEPDTIKYIRPVDNSSTSTEKTTVSTTHTQHKKTTSKEKDLKLADVDKKPSVLSKIRCFVFDMDDTLLESERWKRDIFFFVMRDVVAPKLLERFQNNGPLPNATSVADFGDLAYPTDRNSLDLESNSRLVYKAEKRASDGGGANSNKISNSQDKVKKTNSFSSAPLSRSQAAFQEQIYLILHDLMEHIRTTMPGDRYTFFNEIARILNKVHFFNHFELLCESILRGPANKKNATEEELKRMRNLQFLLTPRSPCDLKEDGDEFQLFDGPSLANEYSRIYLEVMTDGRAQEIPGATELLQYLAEMERKRKEKQASLPEDEQPIKIYVSSLTPESDLQKMVTMYQNGRWAKILDGCFGKLPLATSKDVVNMKIVNLLHIQELEKTASKNSPLATDEIVMVGDSDSDLLGAREFGCHFIGVGPKLLAKSKLVTEEMLHRDCHDVLRTLKALDIP